MMSTGSLARRCRSRSRVMSGASAIDATWLMMLTEWRRWEVLGLRWSEIDLLRRSVRLTATKTGASLRPLSDAACAVISAQPRNGDVVFPNRSGEKPIVGYRKMWLRIAKLGDLRPTHLPSAGRTASPHSRPLIGHAD